MNITYFEEAQEWRARYRKAISQRDHARNSEHHAWQLLAEEWSKPLWTLIREKLGKKNRSSLG